MESSIFQINIIAVAFFDQTLKGQTLAMIGYDQLTTTLINKDII